MCTKYITLTKVIRPRIIGQILFMYIGYSLPEKVSEITICYYTSSATSQPPVNSE